MVVKVSQVVPELLDMLIALIQKACPLAVPRSYVHDPAKISNNAYYRQGGHGRIDTVPGGIPRRGRLRAPPASPAHWVLHPHQAPRAL